MKKLLNGIVLFLFVVSIYGQTPQSYYNGLDLTKTGNALFLELSGKIKSTHVGIPYTASTIDVWDACDLADEDPNNPANVLLIYGYNDTDGIPDTDYTRNKQLKDSGGGVGVWNREHVFAQSLANPNLSTSEPGPGTDVHNLRPADRDRNSLRSNRKFTEGSGMASYVVTSNGGWYPGDEWKGDIARIVMYMYLRYNGTGTQIAETNCYPTNVGFGTALAVDPKMVDLFLKWNVEDPVSAFEANRNEKLAGIQGNRNPFIDNPYLATLIWDGLKAEDKWNMGGSSDVEKPTAPTNVIASNITDTSATITWNASTDNIGVYDYLIYVNGAYMKSSTTTSVSIGSLSANTAYQITVKARDAGNNLSEFSSPHNFSTLIGPLVLFEEDFNNCATVKFVAYSEASTKNWVCEVAYGENNTGSFGINGYQQDVLSKDWLTTKTKIDFDANPSEKLSFYTDAAFGNSPLELVYSSNYDGVGNPANFTWTPVPGITIPIKSNTTGTEEIFKFTDVDISSISGSVYFSFKYYSNATPTRWTVDNFKITADESDDVDGDGVLNVNDLCPNTPFGETVNVTGCSNGQLDDDNDGIQNSLDVCANTPTGENVNSNGCSSSQLDDDGDNVMNNVDLCANTPDGEPVNSNGCSNGQLDDDNDGIQNSLDVCANTPTGENVNSNGCSSSQLDDDVDNIMNNIDLCANTPAGEVVNSNGCSASQLDDDNDGVKNNVDTCPSTPANSVVDITGCPVFLLPSSNYQIVISGETCRSSNNGKITINTANSLPYKVSITGNGQNSSKEFTTSAEFTGLSAGSYRICFTVNGQAAYQQCFDVVITEPADLAVLSRLSVDNQRVDLKLIGGATYFIELNGEKFTTTSEDVSLKLIDGVNILIVRTDLNCQGIYRETIEFMNTVGVFPNPTSSNATLFIGKELSEGVTVEIFNINQQLMLAHRYQSQDTSVSLELANYTPGVYIVKVKTPSKQFHFKLIKL